MRDRRVHRIRHLEPDQSFDTVYFCKPAKCLGTMLNDPRQQVGRDAGLDRAKPAVGNIYTQGARRRMANTCGTLDAGTSPA